MNEEGEFGSTPFCGTRGSRAKRCICPKKKIWRKMGREKGMGGGTHLKRGSRYARRVERDDAPVGETCELIRCRDLSVLPLSLSREGAHKAWSARDTVLGSAALWTRRVLGILRPRQKKVRARFQKISTFDSVAESFEKLNGQEQGEQQRWIYFHPRAPPKLLRGNPRAPPLPLWGPT